jgi:hypothetical protein
LHAKILHDDRKPLSRWLQAQDRYMQLEANHISRAKLSELGVSDRIRRSLPLLAPLLVLFYSYFFKGACLDGKRGLYYAVQRMLAEALLALRLIEGTLMTTSGERK